MHHLRAVFVCRLVVESRNDLLVFCVGSIVTHRVHELWGEEEIFVRDICVCYCVYVYLTEGRSLTHTHTHTHTHIWGACSSALVWLTLCPEGDIVPAVAAPSFVSAYLTQRTLLSMQQHTAQKPQITLTNRARENQRRATERERANDKTYLKFQKYENNLLFFLISFLLILLWSQLQFKVSFEAWVSQDSTHTHTQRYWFISAGC